MLDLSLVLVTLGPVSPQGVAWRRHLLETEGVGQAEPVPASLPHPQAMFYSPRC